jgi:hypothetical protein
LITAGATWTAQWGTGSTEFDSGPALIGGESSRLQKVLPISGGPDLLLIAEVASEPDIHRRLADDPWVLTQRLVTASVEPWNLVLCAQRLGA